MPAESPVFTFDVLQLVHVDAENESPIAGAVITDAPNHTRA
jgi:hypothetical protein